MTSLIFKDPCEEYYKIFTDKQDPSYKYRFLSPFEFKDTLIKNATDIVGETNVIDAGRGNPNFFALKPRKIFTLLSEVCNKLVEDDVISYIPEMHSIHSKFLKVFKKYNRNPEFSSLGEYLNTMEILSGLSKDEFIHELVISTLGVQYPNPNRVQKIVEPIISKFLQKRIYKSKSSMSLNIFPTEGAANAIIYIFNTLRYNGLLIPKDKIGIITPIFSPYLELPHLRNYDLEPECIKMDEDGQISDEEIKKLANNKVRALFLVNPNNPSGLSLSKNTILKISTVIKHSNPNLIVITDSVYAPFTKKFNTFFKLLPENTISIYSYSKYFGVTGKRLGVIAIHESNILDDKLLHDAPEEVHDRYKLLLNEPRTLKFIDRLVADSRQIAESHIAGLSTEQQIQMCIYSVFDLIEGQEYNTQIKKLLYDRRSALLSSMDITPDYSPLNSNYYIIVNICNLSYGFFKNVEFSDYLSNNRDPLEFFIKLAKEYGIVLLPTIGFAGPFWGARISLANLDIEKYEYIGKSIKGMLQIYMDEYMFEMKNKNLLS